MNPTPLCHSTFRLPEIRQSDLQKIRRFADDLGSIESRSELIDCAFLHLSKVIECDFLGWNEFESTTFAPKYFQTIDAYHEALTARLPELESTRLKNRQITSALSERIGLSNLQDLSSKELELIKEIATGLSLARAHEKDPSRHSQQTARPHKRETGFGQCERTRPSARIAFAMR